MSFGAAIKKIWQHPLAKEIQINGADAISIHHRILKTKPLLRRNYQRWYEECLPAYRETENLKGDVIEIGSGAGFLEEFIPNLIKTDVVANPFVTETYGKVVFGTWSGNGLTDAKCRTMIVTH